MVKTTLLNYLELSRRTYNFPISETFLRNLEILSDNPYEAEEIESLPRTSGCPAGLPKGDYAVGLARLPDPGAGVGQSIYTGHEYDSDTTLNYMNARYQDGRRGRFLSQDSVFLAIGDSNQIKQKTGLTLDKYLSDPQGLNSYTYARNNPLKLIDEDGQWFKEVLTGQQSWSSFQLEVGEAAQYMGSGWQTAMDHPYAAGAVVGVSAGAAAYVGAAGVTALSTEYLGGAGTACAAFCSRSEGVSNAISKTVQITSTQGQKVTDVIKGFNHDGTYHGLDQIISRGVSPQMIKNTVMNPLGKFAQSNGNMKYVSEKAMIVVNKAGQVVTGWTNNQFTQKSAELVKSLLKK